MHDFCWLWPLPPSPLHCESARNAKWTLRFDLVSTCNWIGSLTKMPLPLLLLLNANRLHLICELFIKLVNGIQSGWDNVDTKTNIWQESIHAIGHNRRRGFGFYVCFLKLNKKSLSQLSWFMIFFGRCTMELVSGNNLHLQSGQVSISYTVGHTQWVHKLFSIEWTDDGQTLKTRTD